MALGAITISARRQLVCLWCGPVAVVLFGLGFWVFARLLPPPSPALSADAVVALYRGNTTGLRLGVLVMQVAGVLSDLGLQRSQPDSNVSRVPTQSMGCNRFRAGCDYLFLQIQAPSPGTATVPWWIPIGVFFCWMVTNTVAVRKSILVQDRESVLA